VILLTATGRERTTSSPASTWAPADYLTKPFAFAELLARIRAHLRQPGQGQCDIAGGRRDQPRLPARARSIETATP